MEEFESVIGLEIHVQLNTKTKLFSFAPNSFGSEPNTNISEICTGQPGSLPILNKEAIYKAALFGLAIEGKVENYFYFDRKSYFYPDSPRNFQITQYERPIIQGGKIPISEDRFIEISHAHLEDDSGMLKHFSKFSGVDYNRAGVPLLEIVSKPNIFSPQDAKAYAMSIKSIMQYIGASDCNMDKGHLRIDANVSVRKKGEKTLRNKTEIKNMNSFNFLEMALEKEIQRQIEIYKKNEEIKTATYRWDVKQKKTVLMRTKELAADYRYFPEPDIPPVFLTDEYLSEAKKTLPELPFKKFSRFLKDFDLTKSQASILIEDKKLANYFEEAARPCKNPKVLCNWIIVEIFGKLKSLKKDFFELNIDPKDLSSLINMLEEKKITSLIAKKITDDMIKNPKKSPIDIFNENPEYQPIKDTDFIETMVDKVLKENPQSIEDFKKGKQKAFAFLVGQTMKLTKGKASPQLVTDIIKSKIKD